jgi:hypothetical protein
MADPPIHDDVYDPTTDPRHRPPTELPAENPDAARPRDPSDDPQTPSEENPIPPDDTTEAEQ